MSLKKKEDEKNNEAQINKARVYEKQRKFLEKVEKKSSRKQMTAEEKSKKKAEKEEMKTLPSSSTFTA